MEELDLLKWQFRIAKMGREELEETIDELEAEEDRLDTMDERIAWAQRAAVIREVERVPTRQTRAGAGRGGSGYAAPWETVTIDMGEYYAAVEVEQDRAREREARDEIRAMCERRLSHLDRREGLSYESEPSPLKSYIAELEARRGR